MGERLQLDWQVDHLPPELNMPGLTLQPLLENAIYHGIQQLPEGGTVTVKGHYQDGILTITVINPVAGAGAGEGFRVRGNRLAQANIRDRLQALYGPRATLVTDLNDHWHRAEISYPAGLPTNGGLS